MSEARPTKGLIGIFGGTFDPVHYGHLRTALELRYRLGLERVYFVPAATPPHRAAPIASAEVRLHMLQAALEPEPDFVVDERELERSGPSYTVDTAESFRRDYPDRPLCLLLGMDAFLGLPSWHQWKRLLSLVHIVVAHRPGSLMPAAGELGRLLSEHGTTNSAALSRQPAGRVFVAEVTQLEISATALRASIRDGLPARYLMPETVWQVITETECYAAENRAIAES